MFDRIAQWQPDQGAAATARAVGALALAALAVIHVVDLPGTLGPDRLVCRLSAARGRNLRSGAPASHPIRCRAPAGGRL